MAVKMLYINKSAGKPMWQMEYSRDEGLRKYWDEYSPPFHKEGDGPPYRGEMPVLIITTRTLMPSRMWSGGTITGMSGRVRGPE